MVSEANAPKASPPISAPAHRPNDGVDDRLRHQEADAGTFDTLTDNSVALRPETDANHMMRWAGPPIAAADTQSPGAHRLHGRQFGAPPSTTLGCQ
ncbi:MAG: hypothetical protein JWQ31_3526 [Mycobacterium sp.]|nr:hypothetical protein [Mycobacterium sp.]